MNNRQRGVSDSIFIIVIVALLVLSWISLGTSKKGARVPVAGTTEPYAVAMTPLTYPANSGPYQNQGSTINPAVSNGPRSPWSGLVTIDPGTGPSEFEPFRESITLYGSYDIKTPINISGWYLTNGKGQRTYSIGNNVTHFASDIAVIPKAVSILYPGASGATVPILLGANGKVTIVTGTSNYLGSTLPSFRENECIGYLVSDKAKPINLYPNTYSYCADPTAETGVSGLESDCRQFVESMGYCHTPNFVDSVIVDNVPQPGYVDGVGGLSSSCRNFLVTHYNYQSCVANHATDPKFFTGNWRVFLGRPFELWASDHDIMTLYDANGAIVSQYTY